MARTCWTALLWPGQPHPIRACAALAAGLAALAGCQPNPPAALPRRSAPAVHAVAPGLPPRFERYSVSDGLASGFVRGLLQDRQGFLWVATDAGLDRFDGATFAEFVNRPDDPASLGQNYTNRLLEDRLGGIWVGHSSGVDRFDPATERFAHYRAADSARADASVYGLALDAAGAVWVGFGDELARFDPDTGARTRVPLPAGTGGLFAIVPDPDGSLWLGGAGLHHYDVATGAVRAVPLVPAGAAVPRVFALRRDRAGVVWAGTWADGLFRFDPATRAVRHFRANAADPGALGHPRVLSITEDGAGTLWVGTDGGGLARYVPARDAFARTTFEASDPSSLSDDRVTALLEDRTGVLWAGTVSGLCRRLPLSTVVEQHRHRPGDAASLGSDEVGAFAEDADGALWVATNGAGLARRDPATGAFARADLDPGDPASMGDPNLLAVATDSTGAVWAGAYTGLFRGVGGLFDRVPLPAGYDAATALAAAPDGTLWIGAGDLLATDVRRPAVRLVGPGPTSWSVMTMAVGPRGTVDVGTYGDGVFRLSRDGRAASGQGRAARDARTIGTDIVESLYRDRRGVLWVGTHRGLSRIEERDGQSLLRDYSRADGLPHSTVRTVTGDAQGGVWLGSSRGLSRLDPATGSILTFTAADGLQSDNVRTLFRSPRTGRIYVGGDGGYDAFDPAALPDEAPPGPVVLTGLRLADRPVRVGAEGSRLARALSATPELRLGPDDDVVTFQFAALDFSAPAQHRYAVQLDGLQDGWLDVGQRREATFAALPPGRYTLRVRAAGRDGVWGEPSAPLALTVVPPWWRSWWAYAAYALLALGLGVLLARDRRVRQDERHRLEIERLEAEKLRELDRARSHFFANVSHEFRTPLTLTLGPLDDLRAGLHGPLTAPVAEQVDLARRNAGRVLTLINEILDVARLKAGGMPLRARPLDLGAFVAGLARTFAPLAERKGLAFEVVAPEATLRVWADPEHLEKALANLLSNAVKFTPAGGAVRVTVEVAPGEPGPGPAPRQGGAGSGTGETHARVVVRDSGPGIPAADLPHVFDRFYRVDESSARMQPGTGIGLALAKELVDLHGGTLTAASEAGFGSTFTVALRLGRAHLAPDQVSDEPAVDAWTGDAPGAPPPQRIREPGGDGEAGKPVAGKPVAGELVVGEPDDADDVTTVLVVEDNADVRAYVRRHLEPAYRVVEADDGTEGLAKARALLPDLIVSDVMMPGLDGYALCRALRADPETDFIPIVLLTAKAAPEDRLEGLREHCDDYLTKPFEPAELRARIENLIAIRRRLRERFAPPPGPDRRAATGDAGDGPAALRPAPVAAVSADAAFLERVRAEVEAHLGDDAFTVERLATGVGVSRSLLHRRLRELLGQAPSETLRGMRLERAAALLAVRAGTVSEVAYAVGFKSVAHFSNAFTARYGVRPSAYPDGAVVGAEE